MEGIDIGRLEKLARLSHAEIGPSEEDLKLKFLLPLLESLGHDRQGLDFERTGRAGRPDVVIRRLGVVIDTKAYGNNLNDHLLQLGNYAVHEGAVLAVMTNGAETRFYSPLRGISFERSLLHSIAQSDLASEKGIQILTNFLSRKCLTSGEAHWHIDVREKELREAYARIDDLNEKLESLVEDINSEIAALEEQRREIEERIEQKYNERSQGEDNLRYELAAIWDVLGLKPVGESRRFPAMAPRSEVSRQRADSSEEIDFESLILESLSQLGGSARVADVLDRIENKLDAAGKLTAYWLELDPTQIRWKHAVHSTRYQLVKQGKLKATTPRGLWELSRNR